MLEEFGSTFAFILLILLLVINTSDAYDFLQKPEDYINFYHLDITKKNWKWDYLQNGIKVTALSTVGIFIYLHSFLKKDNKVLKILRSICTIILFGNLAYGYYQWYLTGFDH
ncbi:hypothetical protein I5M27_08470 [Adhaeribacter sp. BT258]|uniref:DUF5658 domain-containing protein n=1 Tax=Adhaeribacter terrigena TaxID=2793070 RepID=A0ABS1C109_9BACT|nr:hypothetical protein [Adhaeribacter terrigena]MBK0403019.1 hypothetical protein [Adhaeribacter terrigena]